MLKPLLIAIGFLAPFIGAAWAQDMEVMPILDEKPLKNVNRATVSSNPMANTLSKVANLALIFMVLLAARRAPAISGMVPT